MSDNPFHDAVAEPPPAAPTYEIVNHPHFFQARIDEQRRIPRNLTRQQMFERGLLRVEDLDDEELRFGCCRDEFGKIPKNSAKLEMVPRDLYDEMVAEHLRRTQEKYRQQLDAALNTMVEIMTDESCEPKDRMEAAKHIIERVAGKTPDKVQVQVSKEPWQELLGDVAHITKAQHEAMKAGAIDVESFEVSPNGEPLGPDDGMAGASTVGPHGGEQGHGAPTGVGDAQTHTAQQPAPNRQEPNEQWLAGDGSTFGAAQPAPSHLAPATNQPLSEHLREAQEQAVRVAEARAARESLVKKAKQRRKAQRATGSNVLRRMVDADGFQAAQERFTAAVEDTHNSPERDMPPHG
jgi:hypothetical protein